MALRASFAPYRLGGHTTVGFGFQISAHAGQVPPALTGVSIRYPEELGFVLSGLGIVTCAPPELEGEATGECPANSIMGRGSALAELRFGSELVTESARISIARAPNEDGHIALLVYALGPRPVNTQVLSPAQLLPASPPFGGQLSIQLPIVPSVPGAPDVAVARMEVTLGPQGLTYYEQLDGQTLAYTPRGILLPKTCPRGGFRFAATFTFIEGSQANAAATIPCPRGRARRRTART